MFTQNIGRRDPVLIFSVVRWLQERFNSLDTPDEHVYICNQYESTVASSYSLVNWLISDCTLTISSH